MNKTNTCMLGILLMANETLAQGTQGKDHPKLIIHESDYVMSQDEASKFSIEVISPILIGSAGISEEPQALRRRVRTIVEMIQRRQITYIASPAYYPIRALKLVAQIDDVQSERFVIVFIPELMDWREILSASDFRYAVLVAFAHEMIHLETQSRREFAVQERGGGR